MDALLTDLKIVSEQLIPVFGAVALFFLCRALYKLTKLLDQLGSSVQSLGPAIDRVNTSMEKVQAPLDTAVKLSHTVDDVHAKTIESLSKAAVYASENMDHLKAFVNEKIKVEDVPGETVMAADLPDLDNQTTLKEENKNDNE